MEIVLRLDPSVVPRLIHKPEKGTEPPLQTYQPKLHVTHDLTTDTRASGREKAFGGAHEEKGKEINFSGIT